VSVLAAWGAAENVAGGTWTADAGAVVVAAGAVRNPFGDLADVFAVSNTATQVSSVTRSLTLTGAGPRVVPIFLRGNGSFRSALQLFTGGGALSATLQMDIAGDGSVTVAQESAVGGATVSGVAIPVGTGGNVAPQWWLVLAQYTGLTAGVYALRFYPNTFNAALALSTYVYLRPCWTHSRPLYEAFDAPQARGAVQRFSAAGVRDTWRGGTDETLRGTLRFIPRSADLSLGSSGWDGAGADLVGLGFRALLEQALNAQTIRWVRDRANCAEWTDGQLVEPFDRVDGDVNDDGTKNVPIRLQTTTGQYRGAL
jgi:hypothetical protein